MPDSEIFEYYGVALGVALLGGIFIYYWTINIPKWFSVPNGSFAGFLLFGVASGSVTIAEITIHYLLARR